MPRTAIACICALTALAAIASAAPRVATTIDFGDYVYSNRGNSDPSVYPVAVYEQRLAELAQAGISKLYLRVNVCGVTIYDSKHSARFGRNGAFHWNMPDHAQRLINTLDAYDPLAETIRIGHKYGMEVWAWDSLWDDAGLEMIPADPKFAAIAKQNNYWPLQDPFLRRNPDCQAMISPFRDISPERLEAINAAARKHPIGAIELVNSGKGPSRTLETAKFQVLVSNDNQNYQPYQGTFTVTAAMDQDNRQHFLIRGLGIDADYVKIQHGKFFASASPTPFALSRPVGQCRVFNTAGEEIASTWSVVIEPQRDGGVLSFARFAPAGWDHQGREIGFMRGRIAPSRHFMGMPEYTVPAAMAHKVARFKELTEYPFDGFMFNVRCHSPAAAPLDYGYNPEVLAKFRQRFGRELEDTPGDTAAVMQIRAEAIADFFLNCKRISGGRPIFLSGLPNNRKYRVSQMADFTFLPWLYQRYFRDGSLDGILMTTATGTDFREEFTPELLGGKHIRIGVFREAIDWHRRRQAFVDDLRQLATRADLDEIELYEAEVLNYNLELLQLVKEILNP